MVLPGEGARRASRSLSCGSVSPGKHASGAGKFRAAGVDNSTFRRIVGGTSERRIQRFEVGQARFVQRKSFAGEERAEPAGAHPAVAFRRGNTRRVWESFAPRGWTILRSVESSGVRPSSGFSASKPVRRGSSSGRASPGSRAPEQRQRAFRFVESPENARPSSGFSASKPVRHGSSSGRSSPGSRAPERRQRAFCFVESPENARQSSGFSASKPVRRSSSNGMVLPGKSAEPVGAHPAVAFRRGNARRVWESFAPRGWTILRFVESSGVRPSSGFSASKPVRRGSSSGRSSPGSRAPERRQRAFRFVESPENARQSSGFSASKPGRRGSSRGRVSPGRSAPK